MAIIKEYCVRLGGYFAGQTLSSIGIVLMISANIGSDPWNILHQGISVSIGCSFGTATMLVGAACITIAVLLGTQIGVGTILGVALIGQIVDFIINLSIIPVQTSFLPGLLMLLAGLELLTLGSWIYISQTLGIGPRDALNVSLARKTRIPVGFCRIAIEVTITLIGWALGGKLGIGTVVSAVGLGFLYQINFTLLHFDATTLTQENLAVTVNRIRTALGSCREE